MVLQKYPHYFTLLLLCYTGFIHVSSGQQCDERAACMRMCGKFMTHERPIPSRGASAAKGNYNDENSIWMNPIQSIASQGARPHKLLPLSTGNAAANQASGFILPGKRRGGGASSSSVVGNHHKNKTQRPFLFRES